MSKWERLQSSIQHVLYHLLTWMILQPASWLASAFSKLTLGPFRCFLFVCLFAAEVTLHLLNMRLPKFLLNAVTLKDLSTAGTKIGRMDYWLGHAEKWMALFFRSASGFKVATAAFLAIPIFDATKTKLG